VTPSYFHSDACRRELNAFRKREEQLGYHELILPLYYIRIDRPGDELATAIMTRQYVDFRQLRLHPSDPRLDEQIAQIATQLLTRLKEFYRRQLNTAKICASITTPRPSDHVGHDTSVTLSITGVPSGIYPWLVVETSEKYFPQAVITSEKWTGSVHIGTRGFDNTSNRDYRLHIIAATDTAHETFTHYRGQELRLQQSRGLPRPDGTRILTSVMVRRDGRARSSYPTSGPRSHG
jgi:hypothetical protein